MRDYHNIYFLSLLRTFWLSTLQSPVLGSLFSVFCPFLAALTTGIQYINICFVKLTEGWPQCQSSAGRISSTTISKCKEHLIHHEKYWPQPADNHVSVSQISYSVQPAPIFVAAGWILKHKHRFAEICLLFLQGAANAVVTGISEGKSRRDVWNWKTISKKFSVHHQCCITGAHCFGFRSLRNCLFEWKKPYSQFCNYLALWNTWQFYSAFLHCCIKTG